MEDQEDKIRIFKNLKRRLSRFAPYVITEIHKSEYESLLKIALQDLEPYVVLENITNPKYLFEFIKSNKNELIVVKDDIFSMSKNYLDIAEGAVCSSPDSMALWPVRYKSEEFIFKGKIILCTQKNKHEIKSDNRLKYFVRDCYFI